jgi:hypothetical protein
VSFLQQLSPTPGPGRARGGGNPSRTTRRGNLAATPAAYLDRAITTRRTDKKKNMSAVTYVPYLLPGAFAAVVGALAYRSWKRNRRKKFIAHFEFPVYLRRKLREVRPGLTRAQEDLVFDGLRQYFQACRVAGRRFVSMPSQAVDDAWHAYILSTRAYRDFCIRAFGRFLHHTPAEAMKSPTVAGEGIKRAWWLACRMEKIDPRAPTTLPLLFAVDERLGIADGFRYDLRCEPGGTGFCASGIGCSSGCGSGGCCGDSGDGGGGDGGGGGCGGD